MSRTGKQLELGLTRQMGGGELIRLIYAGKPIIHGAANIIILP